MGEKKLELRSTSTATTYTFHASDGFGWACCSVNDSTGELGITSDYGNWSHRWDARPSSLGHPTLTDFIGTRADVDYIARKLQGRRGGERFSARKTTAALQRLLVQRRREDGHVTHYPHLHRRRRPIDKATARQLWEDLDALAHDCDSSVDLYLERMPRAVYEHLTDEAYHYVEHEQTAEDRALRELVLPALIEACRGTVAKRAAPAPVPTSLPGPGEARG